MDDSSQPPPQDPFEALRQMWAQAGLPLPGMVAPTLDIEDLDKRITDLKTVETWLRMNLDMLQATVQGLEVQRATLNALKAMGVPSDTDVPRDAASAPPNPFAAPFAAMWPWNFTPPQSSPPDTPAKDEPPSRPSPKPPSKS